MAKEPGKIYMSIKHVLPVTLKGGLSAIKILLKEGSNKGAPFNILLDVERFVEENPTVFKDFNFTEHRKRHGIDDMIRATHNFIADNHTAIISMRALYNKRVFDQRDIEEYDTILNQALIYSRAIVYFLEPIIKRSEAHFKGVVEKLNIEDGSDSRVDGTAFINVKARHTFREFNNRYETAVKHMEDLKCLIPMLQTVAPVEFGNRQRNTDFIARGMEERQ